MPESKWIAFLDPFEPCYGSEGEKNKNLPNLGPGAPLPKMGRGGGLEAHSAECDTMKCSYVDGLAGLDGGMAWLVRRHSLHTLWGGYLEPGLYIGGPVFVGARA